MISSKKSATAQRFRINKSPLLVHLLIIIHSLAVFACLANALPWFYKLMILAVVVSSLVLTLRRYHTQFKSYHIQHNETSVWQLASSENAIETIKILPSSVVTCWVILLHFRLENDECHSLIILNDALNEKDYRALAVTLKIAGLCQEDVL
jgi:hypothetical protein